MGRSTRHAVRTRLGTWQRVRCVVAQWHPLPKRWLTGRLLTRWRSSKGADADAPAPIGPRATAARPDRFVWTAVAHAQRYRLRLYDAEGGVLWTDETSDTAAAPPKSVKLSPRSRYFWKV